MTTRAMSRVVTGLPSASRRHPHDVAHHFATEGRVTWRVLPGLDGRYVGGRVKKLDGRVD